MTSTSARRSSSMLLQGALRRGRAERREPFGREVRQRVVGQVAPDHLTAAGLGQRVGELACEPGRLPLLAEQAGGQLENGVHGGPLKQVVSWVESIFHLSNRLKRR
jgi:hypothetical protein